HARGHVPLTAGVRELLLEESRHGGLVDVAGLVARQPGNFYRGRGCEVINDSPRLVPMVLGQGGDNEFIVAGLALLPAAAALWGRLLLFRLGGFARRVAR